MKQKYKKEWVIRNIKNIMIVRNIDIAKLSSRIGRSYGNVCVFLRTDGTPRESTLLQYANALNVTIDDLIKNPYVTENDNNYIKSGSELNEIKNQQKLQDQTSNLERLYYTYERHGAEEIIKINGIAIPTGSVIDVDIKNSTASIIVPLDEIHTYRK